MRDTDNLNAQMLRLTTRMHAMVEALSDMSQAADKAEGIITTAPLAVDPPPHQRPRAIVDMEALGREFGKPAAVKP